VICCDHAKRIEETAPAKAVEGTAREKGHHERKDGESHCDSVVRL